MLCVCLVTTMLVGCGNGEGNKDTSSESGLSEGTQSEQMSETQGIEDSQTLTDTQEGTDTQEETGTQEPLESETQEPTETQKPTESESQQPTETQKPTESESQKPSETQKPTESESQKPSETQKTTESESQEPETQEPETKEPEVQYEEYKLSTQTYDYAEQVSEKYYVVKKNNKYGLVNFAGKEIVPISYDGYDESVGINQIEFYNDNVAYIYDTLSGIKVFEYIPVEEYEYVEYEFNAQNGKTYFVSSSAYSWYWDAEKEEEIDLYRIERDYFNGMLCEVKYVYIKEIDSMGATKYASVIYTNVLTNEIIFSGFSEGGEYFYTDAEPVYEFSSNVNEARAVVVQEDIFGDGEIYIVNIEPNGFTRKKYTGDRTLSTFGTRYSNGWLVNGYQGVFVNINTMEIINIEWEDGGPLGVWGIYGQCCAVIVDYEAGKMDIYNKDKKIKEDCTSVYFVENNDKYIVYSKDNINVIYMDYQGNDLLTVQGCSKFLNGKAMVYDGTGVYYINESLEQISDYVYAGDNLTAFHFGAIGVDGKYYLIGKE